KLIPSMAKTEVAKVSRILKVAREDGAIPWDWIVDETRAVEQIDTWDDPRAYARSVTRWYRRNKWEGQPYRIEGWSEKGTIRGTLEPVLDEFEVAFRVMHGFGSATALHDVAELIDEDDRELVILYVGDWDPSGLYMSEEDIPNRLTEYSETYNYSV